MKKLKITALLLSALFIIGALAGCADKKGGEDTTAQAGTADSTPVAETTESLYDENGYLKDSLPEKLDFGTDINLFIWSDHTMTEFYVEENNGVGIDSAIFRRNAWVEDRLGISLVFTKELQDNFQAAARADYSADCVYDIYATYSRTVPLLSLEGLTADLLSTKYFDLGKPWWPEALTGECVIGGKLFYASGDISTNLLWMMIGTFYNKTMYGSYSADPAFSKTPEEMVKDRTWTMERFFSMAKDIYIDSDGDNARSAGDTYGFVIYQNNLDAFQTAAGVTAVIRTPDGGIEMNPLWTGEYTANVVKMLGEFVVSPGVSYTNKTSIRDIFYGERALFITDRCFIVAGKDNSANKNRIEFSYGVVPQPMAYDDQKNYSTNIGHPYTMYAICSGSRKTEAASAVLEAMGSGSYRFVTPQVFENAMKIKYADGAEAAEMYDILRSTVSFDLGRLYHDTLGGTSSNLFRNSALNNPDGYLTSVKSNMARYEAGIREIIEASGNRAG